MKGERVYIVADGRKVYSGRDYDRALRLREKHWPGALISDRLPEELDLSADRGGVGMRERAKRALLPPRNYRRIEPCCCANCQDWQPDESGEYYVCQRAPDDIAGDWRASEPEFHVCDRHRREKLEVVG